MNSMHPAQLQSLLMKLFTNSKEAIFFFDLTGKILTMNAAAERILDRKLIEEMVMGQADAICLACKGYVSEEEERTCKACFMSNQEADFSSFEIYLDTKDEGIIPYAASCQMIDETQGISVLMCRNLTTPYKTQALLNQRMMMKNIIKAQEDERKRISRELHDSVAQEMLSSLVDLRVLKYMNVEEDVRHKVQQTEGVLMRLLDDIRHLSVELRPATLDDLGLEAAFRTHFKWIEKNYGLRVQFSSKIERKRYEGEVETVVYRICQEAVFNTLKYAETDEVFVSLYEEQNALQLIVHDEGIGFDLQYGSPRGTGLGLFGMRERAELVKGQLRMHSYPGSGTTVQVTIPL